MLDGTAVPSFEPYRSDAREVLRNPRTASGAALGSLLVCGVLSLLVVHAGRDCRAAFDDGWVGQGRAFGSVEYDLALADACPGERNEEEFELEFAPGAVMKLGADVGSSDAAPAVPAAPSEPEALPSEPTSAATPNAVTDDPTPAAVAPDPTPNRTDAPRPAPERRPSPSTPLSKLPKPGPAPAKGDPFGDPGGWAEIAKDGDPWATAVMKALNHMKVGSYGAEIGKGTMKFQLTLCRDGSIKNVRKKGGSLASGDQAKVLTALGQLALPKPPPKLAKKMKTNCAKIKYTFVWSSGDVK